MSLRPCLRIRRLKSGADAQELEIAFLAAMKMRVWADDHVGGSFVAALVPIVLQPRLYFQEYGWRHHFALAGSHSTSGVGLNCLARMSGNLG